MNVILSITDTLILPCNPNLCRVAGEGHPGARERNPGGGGHPGPKAATGNAKRPTGEVGRCQQTPWRGNVESEAFETQTLTT